MTAGHDRSVRLWNPSRLDPAYPPTNNAPLGEQYGGGDDDVPISSLPRALPIQAYEFRHGPTALAVNDESTRILVASDRTAVLLDSVTGNVLRQWHGHTAVINSVAMATDTAILASASYDATVCLWDGRSHSHRPIQTLKEAKDSVTAVHVLQYCIRTASVDGCVRTYDIRKGVMSCDDCHSPITGLAHYHAGRFEHCDPPHSYLAISCLDGAIRVKLDDCDDPQAFRSRRASTAIFVPWVCRDRHSAGRYGLECCFSAEASVVVTGSEDGRAVLYSHPLPPKRLPQSRPVSAVVLRELVGHTAPTCSVAAHPKRNDVIITASYDGNCVVWASRRDYMRW